MGAEPVDRREFAWRIGIFLVIVGLFALMIFVSSDTLRSDKNQVLKQTATAFASQARQTHRAGIRIALTSHLPTPTLERLDSARATQEFIVYGVQALQTRDAELQSWPTFLPTPTLIHPDELKRRSEQTSYFGLFCLGTLVTTAGAALLVKTSPPRKTAMRFEALRKWLQKQREAKEKRAEAKKNKGNK